MRSKTKKDVMNSNNVTTTFLVSLMKSDNYQNMSTVKTKDVKTLH